MFAPPPLPNERERLEALSRYSILDTPPEPAFDELTQLAAQICGTPMALVSLVDEKRQWFKSRVGMGLAETPRDVSFCAHALARPGLFTVRDAQKDKRFAENPLVACERGIRFYAGAPLHSPDGHALGTLCVMDHKPRHLTATQKSAMAALSRQVMAQMELRTRAAELEACKVERTKVLTTALDGMAHHLDNALCPILMSIDLLKCRFVDGSTADLLAIISKSAQRAARIVNQVLSVARGVEGARADVQVQDLIREIEASATSDTYLKHLQVRTVVPKDLWAVTGNAEQLREVLHHLCENASHAMRDGGRLTLSAQNVVHNESDPHLLPGRYVMIDVEDSGTGIRAAVLERIFDPFFTTKEFGKGLGLSTALAIVKSHGGQMRVFSQEGRGTRVKVYLPAVLAPKPSTPEAPLPRGHGELILFVDDEAPAREVTSQTLEFFGYRVVTACDGADALQVYAREQDDVAAVVTDMNMPRLDGAGLIQSLLHIKPDLPIVAASGLASNQARFGHIGAKQFLLKPYTAETLLRVLQQILPKRS